MARPTLLHHPKFRRLSRDLGSDALAIGSLELIWLSCYESGEDVVGDEVDVEAAARWQGEPGKLCEALANAGGFGRPGFIEPIDGDEIDPSTRYRVHDLDDHAPDYVQKRRARELARKQRGTTIREERAQAGQAGGKQKAANRLANSKQTAPLAKQTASNWQANGVTPAPAPAPALKDMSTLAGPTMPRFDFEALYSRYPRKEGKADGMKRLKVAIKSQADFDALAAAVDGYAAKVAREATAVTYVLLWSTFCGGRWRDYAPGAPALLSLVPAPQGSDPDAEDRARRLAELGART